MNFLRRTGAAEETNLKMTAMIDVVFQLLIFFLVGTKFRMPEGELDAYLPEDGPPVENTKLTQPVDEIHVRLAIRAGGKDNPEVPPLIFLDGKSVGEGSGDRSLRWLETRLEALAKDRRIREEVPIIIEAQRELAYKWVIRTLNMTRKLGFKAVKFAASRRNPPLPRPADGKAPPG